MRKILIGILLFTSVACFGQRFPFSSSAHLDVGYCPEYQAVYDAKDAAGMPPDVTNAGYQNTMVKALVDGGYWTDRMEWFYVGALAIKTIIEAYMDAIGGGEL